MALWLFREDSNYYPGVIGIAVPSWQVALFPINPSRMVFTVAGQLQIAISNTCFWQVVVADRGTIALHYPMRSVGGKYLYRTSIDRI